VSVSELCQSCALCCCGALFSHVPVQPDEVVALRVLGLEVRSRPDGAVAMSQPCAALKNNRCDIYEQRPARCREFNCLLAKALENNETSLNEALTIVKEAKEKFAEPARAHLAGRSLRDHLAMYFVRRRRGFSGTK
jgi:Fe-S-cluster containining protein